MIEGIVISVKRGKVVKGALVNLLELRSTQQLSACTGTNGGNRERWTVNNALQRETSWPMSPRGFVYHQLSAFTRLHCF